MIDPIKAFIAESDEVGKLTSFRTYYKAIKELIEKHKFSLIGHGTYCLVYGNPNSKFVIKTCTSKKEKFDLDYSRGYLKPKHISPNYWMAVQPKALSYNEANAKYIKEKEEIDKARRAIDRELNKINNLMRKNAHSAQLIANMKRQNVDNHQAIRDLREDNIGLYHGKAYMIDLNAQFTPSKDSEILIF